MCYRSASQDCNSSCCVCFCTSEITFRRKGKVQEHFNHWFCQLCQDIILSPVSKVFKDTLVSPASTTYARIGADEAEIIFLNDYRYNPEKISWDDLLRLLEGATVHLPAPTNHYAKDICTESDFPIPATSIGPIRRKGMNSEGD